METSNRTTDERIAEYVDTLERQIFTGNLPDMMYLEKLNLLATYYEQLRELKKADDASLMLIEDGTEIARLYGSGENAMRATGLVKKSYFRRAVRHFDDYMIACEWNRVPTARFYLPRRKVLEGQHHIISKIDEFINNDDTLLSLSMPPGSGKLLKNSTKVITNNGWKNHGDLRVGDKVLSPSGEFVKVTAVHPKDYADVMVVFSNGEQIQCHENHEWVLFDRSFGKERIVETKELLKNKLDSGTPNKRGHRYRYQLPHREPMQGKEKELHVPPYTLGVWLGNGDTKHNRICSSQGNLDVIQAVLDDGYDITSCYRHKDTGVLYFHFKDLRSDLQQYGMCHSRTTVEKRIPEEYLTASIEQRLNLLAGLIDTDGSFVKSKHEYRFSTGLEGLKDDVCQLISTFGWRYTLSCEEAKTSSSGIQGRKRIYIIRFCPQLYIPCVLKYKQIDRFAMQRKIAVVDVFRVPKEEGNCITVEGGVYCVGETMIPTHNSTIIKFLCAFIAGKWPLSQNMYVSYSDGMVKMIIDSVESILTDTNEYCHNEIFPNPLSLRISKEYNTISYRRKGDFPTFGFVSLGGSVTGRTRANKFMITDDLVKNAEQARSRERMEKLNADYRATLTTRMIGDNVKQIMLGTIWSAADPISVQIQEHDGQEGYNFIRIPVENESGESNFLYDCPDRYTKEKIQEARENLDPVDFSCLMMQCPIERMGRLFPEEELNFYNGTLPSDEPDAVVAFIDVAWGGGDSLSMPIGYIFGECLYIAAVIFDKGDKKITRPRVVNAIMKHKIQLLDVEANNGGDEYAEDIEQLLHEQTGCYPCTITTHKAPGRSGKAVRIEQQAPVIKEWYFLDRAHRDTEYNEFMKELTAFNVMINVPHDDAPDSCAGLANLVLHHLFKSKVTVTKRPF